MTQVLQHSGLSDLLINGASQAFADFGRGLKPLSLGFKTDAAIEDLARELLQLADRHVDFANPFADCVLTAGQLGLIGEATFRVHVVLASASSPHTLISVRKHHSQAIGLHEFCGGRLELELWLRGVLARRENLLVSGATGAGKTTLLRAMVQQCFGERIIAIEETSELAPVAGHFVSLQTRQANTEGRGAIGLDQLLREALRMRPDRLLLGEVRGPELLTLLNALNTGHRGATATIHANSASAVANRINTIGLQAGWPSRAVAAASAEALQWVVHVESAGGQRTIAEVGRLTLGRRGQLVVTEMVDFGAHL